MPRSRTTATRVVISQEQPLPKARRVLQIERKVAKQLVAEAIEQEEVIGKQNVEDAVFVQMVQHGNYRINGSLEESLVREYIWDKGLTGFSMVDLSQELCDELGIPEKDVIRRAQVKVKVANTARVPRDVRKMIHVDPIDKVAARLAKLVDEFLEGRYEEGALRALRRAGLHQLVKLPEEEEAEEEGEGVNPHEDATIHDRAEGDTSNMEGIEDSGNDGRAAHMGGFGGETGTGSGGGASNMDGLEG